MKKILLFFLFAVFVIIPSMAFASSEEPIKGGHSAFSEEPIKGGHSASSEEPIKGGHSAF